MFIFSNSARNIRRHLRKSIMYFAVCAIATLTFQTYIAGIDRTQQQFDDLPDAMPISARAANLNGQKYSFLQIDAKAVAGLLDSPFVSNLKMTAIVSVDPVNDPQDVTNTSDEKEKPPRLFIVGINTIEALEEYEPDAFTWLPGYGPDSLMGNESICLLSETQMEKSGFTLGDSVPWEIYGIMYGLWGEMADVSLDHTVELRIVGTVNVIGDVDGMITALGDTFISVIPFETARAPFEGSGIPFAAASASFTVNDPHRLNEFKEEMRAIGMEDVSTSRADAARILANSGTALMVNDEAFISAATRLREMLSLLRGFLPLLSLAIAAVGYFVAYLSIQSRREEYAVYRILGCGPLGCFCLFFVELAALTLGGSFIGAAISVFSGVGGLRVGALTFMIFSACFLLGGIIALLRLSRTNVMLALAQSE